MIRLTLIDKTRGSVSHVGTKFQSIDVGRGRAQWLELGLDGRRIARVRFHRMRVELVDEHGFTWDGFDVDSIPDGAGSCARKGCPRDAEMGHDLCLSCGEMAEIRR
jgi:hypothetical protein